MRIIEAIEFVIGSWIGAILATLVMGVIMGA